MMSSCHVNSVLEKLKDLVTMNENLKQQEQEFRTHCRVSVHTHTHTHVQLCEDFLCNPLPHHHKCLTLTLTLTLTWFLHEFGLCFCLTLP